MGSIDQLVAQYSPQNVQSSQTSMPSINDMMAKYTPPAAQAQIQGPPTAEQMLKDKPWYIRALGDIAMHPEDASLGGVIRNIGGVPDIKGAAQNIGNAASGVTNPLPETQAAKDLQQKAQQGTATSGDTSGAILAGESQSPPGQLMEAATKVFPPLGIASNLMGRAVAPIAQATGLDPRDVQLGTQIGGMVLPAMVKGAMSDVDIGKNLPGILGDTTSGKLPIEPIPQASNVKSIASDSYNYSDQKGGILSPAYVASNVIDKVTANLPKSQDFMDFTGGKKTPSMEIAQMFENLRGKPLTLQGAAEIDQYLGNAAENEVNPATGKYTTEGNNIKEMQSALRDAMKNAGEGDIVGGREGFDAYQKAVPLWATSMKMAQIERMIDNAQYADVPATAVKNAFKTFLKNPINLRGLSDDEIAVAQKAAETGIVTGALKILGSKLMSGAVGTTAGALGGGPLGAVGGLAAGEAIGYPLRQMASARQTARGNAVLDKLASRPVVQDALNEYSNAAANPTPEAASIPEAPKQITYQPQPTIYAGTSEGIRPQNAAEQASGIMARRAAQVNGTSPGTNAAAASNALRAAQDLMGNKSQSELGRFAQENANQPIEKVADKFQPQENTPSQVDQMFNRAKDEQLAKTADTQKMTDEAKAAKFMADNDNEIKSQIEATAERYKDAGIQPGTLGEALMNILKNESGALNLGRIKQLLEGLSTGKIPGLIAASALATTPANNPAPTLPKQLESPKVVAVQPMSYETTIKEPVNTTMRDQLAPILDKIAQAESQNGKNTVNANSNAAGKYQFMPQTWMDMVKKYGTQTGIGLGDINNENAQKTMARLLAQENIKYLQSNFGRMPTKGELYMAHVLGGNGAARLTRAQGTGRPTVGYFPPAVAMANRPLFYQKDGRPMTVEETYHALKTKMD